MKHFLTVLFFLFSLGASAQNWRPQPFFYKYKGIMADSLLRLGVNDTTMYPATSHSGAMIFRRQSGDTAYYYSNGKRWKKIGSEVDLSAYMRYLDTAAMLSPYLRKVDTTAMLAPYLRKRDTVTISNRINLKENLIVPGTTVQYRRGDKTWQTLNVAAVSGLQDSLTGSTLQRTTDRGNVTNNTVVLSGMGKLTAPPGTSSLLHSTIDHSFNMFNTNAAGTVNSTFQLGEGKLDVTADNDNYYRSNAGILDIKSITPSGDATFRLSSNPASAGASTFNLWKTDPSYQYGIFSDMDNRKVGFAVEVAQWAGAPGFPHMSANLIAETDSARLTFISGTGGNSSLIKTNNSFRFNYDNSPNTVGLQMATVTNSVVNNFYKDGRVSGTAAANNNEFVTRSQGDGRYLLNQNASAQTGNAWVTGYLRSDFATVAPMMNSGSSAGTLSLVGGNGTTNRGAEIELRGPNNSTNPGAVLLRSGTGTGTQPERMRIASDGKIGIGNSAPSATLDMSTSAGVELGFSGTSQANIYHQSPGQGLYLNTNSAPIWIGANGSGSQHITVLPNGNVGIGTSTPSTPLEVAGIAQAQRLQSSGAVQEGLRLLNDGAYLSFFNTSGTTRTGFLQGSTTSGITIAGDLDLPLKLNTNSLERVRILGSGNVGIGTATPAEKLSVAGNISATASLMAGGLVLSNRVITASYTVTTSDYTIINRATSGTPTLTLPSASSNPGRVYFLSDEAGTPQMMTISPGIVYKGTTYTTFNNPFFAQGPRAHIQSDGTNWVILIN